MSDLRAEKSGLAREAQKKVMNKYDSSKASCCMDWLAIETGIAMDISGDQQSVYEQLKDGYVLCVLANKIKEGSIPASYLKERASAVFKQREMLELFNKSISKPPLSVSPQDLFTPPDLYEKENMAQVITCLESVARKCLTVDTPVKGFGPKEAVAHNRRFKAEQKAQGNAVIGLQMGSNKGASQSGQNFGKARMIMD